MKYKYLIIFLFSISCLITIPRYKNIKKVGRIKNPNADGVAVKGNYVIAGYSIIDITNKKKPKFIVEKIDPSFGIMTDIHIINNYLFASNGGNFAIYDISDIHSPKKISYIKNTNIPYWPSFDKFTISGDYVYISGWSTDGGYLVIINISDPKSPKLESVVQFKGSSFGNAIQGDYAYVAAKANGMYIIDIKNKKEPKIISNFKKPDPNLSSGHMSGGNCVAVKGNYAYLTDLGRLIVIDVSDPYHPKEAATFYRFGMIKVKFPQGYSAYTPGDLWDIKIEDDLAYVGDMYGGLLVLDISDPANPVCIGYYSGKYGVRNLSISGNYVFTVSWGGISGVVIYDVSKVKALKKKMNKR